MTGLRESLDGSSQMSRFRSERQAGFRRAQVMCGVVFGYSFVRGRCPTLPSIKRVHSQPSGQDYSSTLQFTRFDTLTIMGRPQRGK
jgi:hypothetical protein